MLNETMRTAICPQTSSALIQQADKFEDDNSTGDRVATIVEAKFALKNPDAMKCDAVHRSTDRAEAWGEDGSEACDVGAVNRKGGLFCYSCGGQGHVAAKCATTRSSQGQGERRRKGRKSRR